ncbi:MAG: hypothetical protein FE78DRAFT_99288 [Acidomyces sp. 'richmondensis']|nr:MAG: hypothetical protein FE78DRAFT_99288 [Acidomyces sp. 'richmondensis']
MSREYRSIQHPAQTATREEKRNYLQARNQYFQAIKVAKNEHWNTFLEKGDPHSIFKAFKYTRQYNRAPIPSINGKETFEDKCAEFKETLLPPPPAGDDLPARWSTYIVGQWQWPKLTEEELKAACSTTKEPTPESHKEAQSHQYYS